METLGHGPGHSAVRFSVRHSIVIIFLSLLQPVHSDTLLAQPAPLRLVNPFVGTDAHGHTFPGATVPFGMVQLSPDTRVEGWDACGGYHYSDSTILGFSHTHLSGTGIPDYGDILFLPTIGNPSLRTRQAFSHSAEEASPGYYRVDLNDDKILVELTASARVGVHRYTFPTSTEANILIDLRHGLGPDVVTDSWLEFASDREIRGYRRSTGWAKDQQIYFVAQFSKPFQNFGDVGKEQKGSNRLQGTNVRGFVRFASMAKEPIVVKVGISSVDIEGAKNNLREVPHWDFEQVRQSAQRLWQKELGKIMVEGGTESQQRTFYTALYHTMIAPNVASDLDGRYRGMDHRIRTASHPVYTVFSLWDTFRALHPLHTMLNPDRTRDFVRTMLVKYDEAGVLPVWELASNETWTMIGYHSVPVILDAYVKGIVGFDTEKAFRAMKHSAMLDQFGLKPYREFGHIPGDKDSESVSRTLEYAFDDWCIAEMARRLGGKPDDVRLFSERSQYYRNVFDPMTGFMRPRINGQWAEPFDPRSVTVHYTEANAWQYTFFVPHDPAGLIELMGGTPQFEERLDSLFFGSSEMTGRKQSDITGIFGQYAQGNEPSHHYAYLYNYTASPWKTQKITRLIMDSLYTDQPDGLCGNDDCGQMSAWYVFTAMGFYPVTPGTTEYHATAPLFDRIIMRLDNGKEFSISKKGSGRYIRRLTSNGADLPTYVIQHEDIVGGGAIEVHMGETTAATLKPITIRNQQSRAGAIRITPTPYFTSRSRSFVDSLLVEIHSSSLGSRILYRIGPTAPFRPYSGPIVVRQNSVIHAFAEKDGQTPSKAVVAEFTKSSFVGTIRLETGYSHQYAGGGDQALVDGMRGGKDFRLGVWQGYEGTDLLAVLDLGKVKEVNSVRLGCLQDENSWIFFPEYTEFSFSSDGKAFSEPVRVSNDVPQSMTGGILKEFSAKGQRARYIKVHAKNIGNCPPWHKGAGGKAWLFVDELVVE